MKLAARIVLSASALLLMAGATGCNKLRARDQLVKGVQNFKAGRYEEAVGNFQESIRLDPNYPTAHLYLATAYSYQVTPDLDSPDNKALAQKAIDGFDTVLQEDPHDIGALRQEASIYRKIKDFDKAKELEQKVIAENPNDAEAYYTIGVIDWTRAYKNAVATLGVVGITDDGNGNVKMPKDVCAKLQQQNTTLVANAMQSLQKAVDINSNYDDAMQYLNLDYRRKADLECGNDAARKDDLAQADMWVQRATGARKANEAEKEKKLGGGVTMK